MEYFRVEATIRENNGSERLGSFNTSERDSEVTPHAEHELTFDLICARNGYKRLTPVKVIGIDKPTEPTNG